MVGRGRGGWFGIGVGEGGLVVGVFWFFQDAGDLAVVIDGGGGGQGESGRFEELEGAVFEGEAAGSEEGAGGTVEGTNDDAGIVEGGGLGAGEAFGFGEELDCLVGGPENGFGGAVGVVAESDDGAAVVDRAGDKGAWGAEDLADPAAGGLLGPEAGDLAVDGNDVAAVVAQGDDVGAERGFGGKGGGGPAVGLAFPVAGSDPAVADRVAADAAAVAGDAAGDRGVVVGQGAEALDTGLGMPDEGLVAERDRDAQGSGFADAADDVAGVAERGGMGGGVALEVGQIGDLPVLGEKEGLFMDFTGTVGRLDPFEADELAEVVEVDGNGRVRVGLG